jgi:hypothetical protein
MRRLLLLLLAAVPCGLSWGRDDPSAVASSPAAITAPADGIRVPLGPMPGPVPGAVSKNVIPDGSSHDLFDIAKSNTVFFRQCLPSGGSRSVFFSNRSDKFFGEFRGMVTDSGHVRSVPDFVKFVFVSCAPAEVVKSIVFLIAVEVTANVADGTLTYERSQNETVNGIRVVSSVQPKTNAKVARGSRACLDLVPRITQMGNGTGSNTLPLFHAGLPSAPYAAVVSDSVARESGNVSVFDFGGFDRIVRSHRRALSDTGGVEGQGRIGVISIGDGSCFYTEDDGGVQPKGSPRISVVPFDGAPKPLGSPIRLNGAEFEILTLLNYEGPVTWDVAEPSGGKPPLIYFEPKAGAEVIGFRSGQSVPGKYTVPDTTSLVVYGNGTGKAVVSAWGVEGGKPKKLTSELIESNTGPRPPPPDPDPDPKPKPDPDPPAPKAELVWVVIVEETSMRTPDIARVLNDTGYWNGLKAKGHLIRFYDRDSEEARKSGYVKRADSVGLPAVILYDQKQGNHLKTFRMTSTAAIDSEIKAVTK